MDLEFLYPLISETIRRAETLEDSGAPGAKSAYLDLSLLEERVTEILPASDPEGALARRGAVRAALAAGDLARARRLSELFLAERDADTDSMAEIAQLLEKAERATAARFPRVAAVIGFSEIRRIAFSLHQQGAPLPIR
jgi:hypothetical protein